MKVKDFIFLFKSIEVEVIFINFEDIALEPHEPVETKKDALAEAMEALTGDHEDENIAKSTMHDGKCFHI